MQEAQGPVECSPDLYELKGRAGQSQLPES
jgi:hypothetical protein